MTRNGKNVGIGDLCNSKTKTKTKTKPYGSVLANLYATTDKSLMASIKHIMDSHDDPKVKVFSVAKVISTRLEGPQEIIDDLEFLSNANKPMAQKMAYIRERY